MLSSLQLFLSLILIAYLLQVIIVFIRYEPKLDLVLSNNKYKLLLWYNKYDWLDETIQGRTYIKLFEV